MKHESGLDSRGSDFQDRQGTGGLQDSLYLNQVRAILCAATKWHRQGHAWPVLVQDRAGVTVLRAEIPSLLAVQNLREDLAAVGYGQVPDAAQGVYVFRMRKGAS